MEIEYADAYSAFHYNVKIYNLYYKLQEKLKTRLIVPVHVTSLHLVDVQGSFPRRGTQVSLYK